MRLKFCKIHETVSMNSMLMKKSFRCLLVFAVCLAGASASGIAETLQGTVAAVNPSDKDIVILLKEKGGREVQVLVSERAKLLGRASLSELKEGDEVLVNGIEEKESGLWKAERLEFRRAAQ